MIIKAQQSIIDNENNRIHEQKVIIDLEDEFVTISHNGDELNMSTKAFDELIKMVCEASKQRHKLSEPENLFDKLGY